MIDTRVGLWVRAPYVRRVYKLNTLSDILQTTYYIHFLKMKHLRNLIKICIRLIPITRLVATLCFDLICFNTTWRDLMRSLRIEMWSYTIFHNDPKLLHACPDGRDLCQDLTLQWRHNDYDCISNHRRFDCLLKRLFRRRSMKTSELRVTGLCAFVRGVHRWRHHTIAYARRDSSTPHSRFQSLPIIVIISTWH